MPRASSTAFGAAGNGGDPQAKGASGASRLKASPRIMGLCYFCLGPGGRETADAYLKRYYAIAGEELQNAIASSAAVDAETIRAYRDGFVGAGADELVCFPCTPDPAQVDLLADAVL